MKFICLFILVFMAPITLFFSMSLVFSIFELKILPILFSFLMTMIFGGLSYLFYGLYRNGNFLNDFKFSEVDEANLAKYDEPSEHLKPRKKQRKDMSAVETIHTASAYRFDYINSAGELSSRHIKFSRVTQKNGNTYLNGVDLDKHASRTFRADRILSLVDMDTGEMIMDAKSYFEAVL